LYNLKKSPKRSLKSIFEEGQTSRECHVKQAMPDSKDRECHVKKTDQEDRKVAWAARATWHGRATTVRWARPDRAMWHGRATCVACGTANPCHVAGPCHM